MANQLEDCMPKILAQALNTLREQAVIPLLVNSDYSADAAKKGQVIDVPVPTKMRAVDVQPGPFSQAVDDLTIETVQIPLNNWKESAFRLSDKELMEIMDGVPSMQVTEASRALGNAVASSIYQQYKGIYNAVGTAGTTPFATNGRDATNARKFLNRWLTPDSDRRIILDVDAEANALNLDVFQRVDASGSSDVLRNAVIGRKFGFEFYYDQLMPTHISGGLAGPITIKTVPTVTTTNTGTPGLRNPDKFSSVTLTGATGGSMKEGDLFTVAGDSQTYVVRADAARAGADITVLFSPAPQAPAAWVASAAVTILPSHVVNLAFHRDSIALAVRSLNNDMFQSELGGMIMTLQDPVTRIPLRLEVRREYKQIRWSLDILWGTAIVRPETACRILG
jgi:P22 coat protein - gene protein 5